MHKGRMVVGSSAVAIAVAVAAVVGVGSGVGSASPLPGSIAAKLGSYTPTDPNEIEYLQNASMDLRKLDQVAEGANGSLLLAGLTTTGAPCAIIVLRDLVTAEPIVAASCSPTAKSFDDGQIVVGAQFGEQTASGVIVAAGNTVRAVNGSDQLAASSVLNYASAGVKLPTSVAIEHPDGSLQTVRLPSFDSSQGVAG